MSNCMWVSLLLLKILPNSTLVNFCNNKNLNMNKRTITIKQINLINLTVRDIQLFIMLHFSFN